MRKLHGFVISWYYPPGNSSEGLVTYKLLKNSGFTYDVFTRKSHDLSVWDRKTDESKLTADNVSVFHANTNNEDKWVQEAVEFFEAHAGEYDFIMSRVMPGDSHLAAARIKEKHPEIFWAASFGDPLVNSPYIKLVDEKENPYFLADYYCRELPSLPKLLHLAISPTRWARKKVWEKERIDEMVWPSRCKYINDITFEKADLLIFNNQYQIQRAFVGPYKKYENKGVVINHSFDPSLYPKNIDKIADGKLHFVYVGHLDALRNAKALFDALGKMKQYDQDLADKVQFDFYGHIDDSDKVAIVDNDLSNIVHLRGDVDYLTSLKIMKNADWLILIDTNLNDQLDEYIYFPAKLVDYFGARNKIFAITQLKGASADAMHDVQAGVVATHSADEISTYLAKIIYKKYTPVNYQDKAWAEYDVKNVAKKFDKIITEHLDK